MEVAAKSSLVAKQHDLSPQNVVGERRSFGNYVLLLGVAVVGTGSLEAVQRNTFGHAHLEVELKPPGMRHIFPNGDFCFCDCFGGVTAFPMGSVGASAKAKP